jgi:3-isopropylmalate dehydratase small subunit
MGDEIEVDLTGGVVYNRTRNTSHPFQMKAEDSRTFQAGGMTARVRAHLEELLAT